jgi:hypothetical protein
LGANTLVVDPGSGLASLTVANLPLFDYFTIPNALLNPTNFNPAVASFQVHWAKSNQHVKVSNPAEGFSGQFVQNTATMSWSVSSQGNVYQSAPESTSFSLFAQVGHEQNGVFMPNGGG